MQPPHSRSILNSFSFLGGQAGQLSLCFRTQEVTLLMLLLLNEPKNNIAVILALVCSYAETTKNGKFPLFLSL